jgi:hypothetical protein
MMNKERYQELEQIVERLQRDGDRDSLLIAAGILTLLGAYDTGILIPLSQLCQRFALEAVAQKKSGNN